MQIGTSIRKGPGEAPLLPELEEEVWSAAGRSQMVLSSLSRQSAGHGALMERWRRVPGRPLGLAGDTYSLC